MDNVPVTVCQPILHNVKGMASIICNTLGRTLPFPGKVALLQCICKTARRYAVPTVEGRDGRRHVQGRFRSGMSLTGREARMVMSSLATSDALPPRYWHIPVVFCRLAHLLYSRTGPSTDTWRHLGRLLTAVLILSVEAIERGSTRTMYFHGMTHIWDQPRLPVALSDEGGEASLRMASRFARVTSTQASSSSTDVLVHERFMMVNPRQVILPVCLHAHPPKKQFFFGLVVSRTNVVRQCFPSIKPPSPPYLPRTLVGDRGWSRVPNIRGGCCHRPVRQGAPADVWVPQNCVLILCRCLFNSSEVPREMLLRVLVALDTTPHQLLLPLFRNVPHMRVTSPVLAPHISIHPRIQHPNFLTPPLPLYTISCLDPHTNVAITPNVTPMLTQNKFLRGSWWRYVTVAPLLLTCGVTFAQNPCVLNLHMHPCMATCLCAFVVPALWTPSSYSTGYHLRLKPSGPGVSSRTCVQACSMLMPVQRSALGKRPQLRVPGWWA